MGLLESGLTGLWNSRDTMNEWREIKNEVGHAERIYLFPHTRAVERPTTNESVRGRLLKIEIENSDLMKTF